MSTWALKTVLDLLDAALTFCLISYNAVCFSIHVPSLQSPHRTKWALSPTATSTTSRRASPFSSSTPTVLLWAIPSSTPVLPSSGGDKTLMSCSHHSLPRKHFPSIPKSFSEWTAVPRYLKLCLKNKQVGETGGGERGNLLLFSISPSETQ